MAFLDLFESFRAPLAGFVVSLGFRPPGLPELGWLRSPDCTGFELGSTRGCATFFFQKRDLVEALSPTLTLDGVASVEGSLAPAGLSWRAASTFAFSKRGLATALSSTGPLGSVASA